MDSKEYIVQLKAKLIEGKEKILGQYKVWGKAPATWHQRWFEYSHLLDKALSEQEPISVPANHSKAWHMLKKQAAITKWKHTLKANRGADPKFQPLEEFT